VCAFKLWERERWREWVLRYELCTISIDGAGRKRFRAEYPTTATASHTRFLYRCPVRPQRRLRRRNVYNCINNHTACRDGHPSHQFDVPPPLTIGVWCMMYKYYIILLYSYYCRCTRGISSVSDGADIQHIYIITMIYRAPHDIFVWATLLLSRHRKTFVSSTLNSVDDIIDTFLSKVRRGFSTRVCYEQ